MENVSAVTSFILTAYTELEDHQYLYFTGFLFLYNLILLVNSVLIVVIYIERGLHEPMYLLICNLAVNGVFGGTFLLPSILGHLLSQNYEISLTRCLLQIYCLLSYGSTEFTILAVMSYDRYVAISHPLHYHLLMSPRKLYAVIALSWVIPYLFIALRFILTVRLSFCGRIIEKLYCLNFPVVKLSCFDTTYQSIFGIATMIITPCSQIAIILFYYAKILRVCLSTSKESQSKALQTCTPHLLSLVNFSLGALFELLQSRFNMSYVPFKARIFMSLYFWLIPTLFNPIVYGISIQAIRVQILKRFSCKEKLTGLNSR